MSCDGPTGKTTTSSSPSTTATTTETRTGTTTPSSPAVASPWQNTVTVIDVPHISSETAPVVGKLAYTTDIPPGDARIKVVFKQRTQTYSLETKCKVKLTLALSLNKVLSRTP